MDLTGIPEDLWSAAELIVQMGCCDDDLAQADRLRALADAIESGQVRAVPDVDYSGPKNGEECDACRASHQTSDPPCDYHRGYDDGWSARDRAVRAVPEQPETGTLAVPGALDSMWFGRAAAIYAEADAEAASASPPEQPEPGTLTFTTEFAVRLLDAESHEHGSRGGTWVRYDDAVKLAHQLHAEHEAVPAAPREQADPLDAAADPRVIAVVLARDVLSEWEGSSNAEGIRAQVLLKRLGWRGITPDPKREAEQARALLGAVAAWNRVCRGHDCGGPAACPVRAKLTVALDAILGTPQ